MRISYKFFQKYISNIIIVLMVVFLGVITYKGGSVGVFSSSGKNPIFVGNEQNNCVSLMFNVYMGNEYVDQIIDILKENDVKATFFVGGIWVEKNNECFMNIYKSKNEIGSHGYWHKDHSKLSNKEQLNEILLTDKLVSDMIGIKMTLFAPPSGAYNKSTTPLAESVGYKTIMWSKDTIDWRDQNEDLIIERATKNVKAGDLILMHPTNSTTQALDKIIKTIKSKGLKIDTVSNNLK